MGRILDGASDYVVRIATGIALAHTIRRSRGATGVALACLGVASIVAQGTLFDHAKNRYLSLTRSTYREGDDLADTLAEIATLERDGNARVEVALLRVYATFLRVQSALARSRGNEITGTLDEPTREELARIAAAFAWLGPSTHVALLAVFGAADRLELYTLARVTIGNVVAVRLARRLAAVERASPSSSSV